MQPSRFDQCPSLHIPVTGNTIAKLQETIRMVIQYVSENKLSELMDKLRASNSLFIPENVDAAAIEASSSSSKRKKGKKENYFDVNAEFRARLLALIQYLKNRNLYEAFDVQFPSLPVPAETPWFKLNGPVVLFLQNRGATMLCRIIFPSMTKEGQPIMSYDNLAKSHRWTDRLMSSILYTVGSLCNTPCLGTPVAYSRVKRRKGKCIKDKYFMPCGYMNFDWKKSFRIENYTVWQVNTNHASIKSYFNKSTIKDMVYSILPSDWEMYVGARYMLISENKKYFMLLMRDRLGVFHNHKNENLLALNRAEAKQTRGLYKYGIRFKGTATKAIIEAGVLTIYGDDGKGDENAMLFRLQLAKGGVQPTSLFLHDDGSLSLFDADNKNVLDLSALDAILDRQEQELTLRDYDPNMDYRERILRLLQWLKARNLISSIIMPGDETSSEILKKLQIEYEDLTPDALFNPLINYQERVTTLINQLRVQYPDISLPSESTVNMKFNVTYETEAEAEIPYDPLVDLGQRTKLLEAQLQDKN